MERLPNSNGELREVPCKHCGGSITYLHLEKESGGLVFEPPRVCDDCIESMKPAPEPPAALDVKKQLAAIGVNVRQHGDAKLSDFDEDPKALAAARMFVDEVVHADDYTSVQGLLLVGPPGNGKTYMSVAIIRDLIEQAHPRELNRLVFDRSSRLITEIQDTYGTGGTGAVIQKREKARLWILDDLGTEKATEDTLRILHDILDARQGAPTVITSNLTPNELGQRWKNETGWARIASRLGPKNYRRVGFRGDDRRQTAA